MENLFETIKKAIDTIRLEEDNQDSIYSNSMNEYDLGVVDGLKRARIIIEAYLKHYGN